MVCHQRVQGEALSSSTLTQVKNSSYAGRLKLFYPKWRQLTSNPWVLSCVKGYKLPFTKTPLQAQSPHFSPAPKNFGFMSKAVQELLLIGAISPCSPRPGQYLSRVFLADKPNVQKQFILNLKLNKCIAGPHFLVPIRPKDRKYLRFSLENQLFEFNCLPFHRPHTLLPKL
jgi:hypothetical protein